MDAVNNPVNGTETEQETLSRYIDLVTWKGREWQELRSLSNHLPRRGSEQLYQLVFCVALSCIAVCDVELGRHLGWRQVLFTTWGEAVTKLCVLILVLYASERAFGVYLKRRELMQFERALKSLPDLGTADDNLSNAIELRDRREDWRRERFATEINELSERLGEREILSRPEHSNRVTALRRAIAVHQMVNAAQDTYNQTDGQVVSRNWDAFLDATSGLRSDVGSPLAKYYPELLFVLLRELRKLPQVLRLLPSVAQLELQYKLPETRKELISRVLQLQDRLKAFRPRGIVLESQGTIAVKLALQTPEILIAVCAALDPVGVVRLAGTCGGLYRRIRTIPRLEAKYLSFAHRVLPPLPTETPLLYDCPAFRVFRSATYCVTRGKDWLLLRNTDDVGSSELVDLTKGPELVGAFTRLDWLYWFDHQKAVLRDQTTGRPTKIYTLGREGWVVCRRWNTNEPMGLSLPSDRHPVNKERLWTEVSGRWLVWWNGEQLCRVVDAETEKHHDVVITVRDTYRRIVSVSVNATGNAVTWIEENDRSRASFTMPIVDEAAIDTEILKAPA